VPRGDRVDPVAGRHTERAGHRIDLHDNMTDVGAPYAETEIVPCT
jgi:hypothetical protein